MATATKSYVLSEDQKGKVVALFEKNPNLTYTAIAKKLKLEYISVNKFMTKWKAQHGLLKSRSKGEEVKPVSTQDGKMLVDKDEFLFLKKYYLQRSTSSASTTA